MGNNKHNIITLRPRTYEIRNVGEAWDILENNYCANKRTCLQELIENGVTKFLGWDYMPITIRIK